MAALDHAPEGPGTEAARERLRERARAVGMRLQSFTVTEEPIPDPAMEALPRADFERIAAISRDMRSRPKKHIAELDRLAAKHPHIPMLQNHLAGALEAAGQRERAARIIGEAARRFPTYVFAFCNHVMLLLSEGRIDQARALVETGARGPVFTLSDFDPTRDTFHISEAISHAAMVGQYMLATGRREAAEVQLEALRKIAPESAQFRSLEAAMEGEAAELLTRAALLLRAMAARKKRGGKTGANPGTKRRGQTTAAPAEGATKLETTDPSKERQ